MTLRGNTRPLGTDNGERRKDFNKRVSRAITEMAQPAPPVRRKRKHPPPGETSRDKFLRLATARTQTALQTIRLIGNLANQHVYRYEDQDVALIHGALTDAVSEAISQFSRRERPEIKFHLQKSS